MQARLRKLLDEYSADLYLAVTWFHDHRVIEEKKAEITDGADCHELHGGDGSVWKLELEVTPSGDTEDEFRLRATFRVVSGKASNIAARICFRFDDWRRDSFVLIPSTAYNGNRFESRHYDYPPFFEDPSDWKVDSPVIITDVPRLNDQNGISRIQSMAGEQASPSVGFHSSVTQKGFLLFTHPATRHGDNAISIEESGDRKSACMEILTPGVRTGTRYIFGVPQGKMGMMAQAEDQGADLAPGEEIESEAVASFFKGEDVGSLYAKYFDLRKVLFRAGKEMSHRVPFSRSWDVLEKAFNDENWVEQGGYFSMGPRGDSAKAWLLGWAGMMMHPMLIRGNPLTVERALRNIGFLFASTQAASGFLYASAGTADDDEIHLYGDHFVNRKKKEWTLLRRDADGLFYLAKCLLLLEDRGIPYPVIWKDGVRKLAAAFLRLWKRYGQLGQLVDIEKEQIILGGTSSSGIAPAALIAAGMLLDEPEMKKTAVAIGRHFFTEFTKKGLSNGGPSEILQCADSESSYGLLESYVTAYEATGDGYWLDASVQMAAQFSTWCVAYDYEFPRWSEFSRLGIQSRGSVYANVQNKHAAPGICTHSGLALFRLFRYTGDLRYLELLREIAHGLAQYIATEDRPIRTWDDRILPPGWVNERVNLCDWQGKEKVGGVFYFSCWCAVSCLMTFADIPGLYVQPDTGLVAAMDHVEVLEKERKPGGLQVVLRNPTPYDARLSFLSESSAETRRPMGITAPLHYGNLTLRAHETRRFDFHPVP